MSLESPPKRPVQKEYVLDIARLRAATTTPMELGLVAIAWLTGAPPSQLAGLRSANLTGNVLQWRTRGGFEPSVTVPSADVDTVAAWLARRGGRRSPHRLAAILREVSLRAGIEPLTTRDMRRARIARLLRRGYSPREVRRTTGASMHLIRQVLEEDENHA